MEFTLTTEDEKVTPMLDLERINVITTSNRINSKVSDYAKDSRINGLFYDPHVASYVTKIVSLEKSSDNLKVLFDAYRHSSNDIRVMYRLFRSDADPTTALYELFPGYDNLTEDGEVVNVILIIMENQIRMLFLLLDQMILHLMNLQQKIYHFSTDSKLKF